MNFREEATEKLDGLAKPPKSLGHLEEIAIQIAECQKTLNPSAKKIRLCIFAGDHGVAREEKVSPYPPSVTALMVKTFLAGKAAISSIANANNVELEVINCGVENFSGFENNGESKASYHDSKIDCAPTNNIRKQPAMSDEQLAKAIDAGKKAALRALESDVKIVGAGEMGIGNTTSATAIFCKLYNIPAADITGPGTGLDQRGIVEKTQVIHDAISRTAKNLTPWEVGKELGGFEIVAMTAYYLELKKHNIPILLDGFITTASAALAIEIDPSIKPYFIVSTISGEPAHRKILKHLGLEKSIFDLGLRLGEGTGACLAAGIIRSACEVINKMATLNDVLENNI